MPAPPRPPRPPRSKRRDAADADLQALLDGRQQLWRLEFSAQLLGRRFVAVCAELGLDPLALPLARRAAIDAQMVWPAPGAAHDGQADDGTESLAAQLRALLLQPLH